ncbi:MAG: hypothetical protein ABH874_05485 [Methanobacteriota archaeon]
MFLRLRSGKVLTGACMLSIGVEREIFDRLDLGVERLGTINDKLTSVDKKLDTLEDIKGLLEKIAEK